MYRGEWAAMLEDLSKPAMSEGLPTLDDYTLALSTLKSRELTRAVLQDVDAHGWATLGIQNIPQNSQLINMMRDIAMHDPHAAFLRGWNAAVDELGKREKH